MSDIFDQAAASMGQTAQPKQDVFDMAAQSLQGGASTQPDQPQDPTGISRLWTFDRTAPPSGPSNWQQIRDAATGAGKSIVKGLSNVGDIATLGLTHLLPGS